MFVRGHREHYDEDGQEQGCDDGEDQIGVRVVAGHGHGLVLELELELELELVELEDGRALRLERGLDRHPSQVKRRREERHDG